MPATQALLNSQRWRRLIPVAFITYSFAYLDRSNYSIGTAGGLTARLHITPAQAGFLGGLFFLGLLPVPGASRELRRAAQRQGPGVLVTVRLGRARRAARRHHHTAGCSPGSRC